MYLNDTLGDLEFIPRNNSKLAWNFHNLLYIPNREIGALCEINAQLMTCSHILIISKLQK